MKCELLYELTGTDGEAKPIGTVIDHPDAYKLVKMGCAKPADAECLERAEEWAARLGKPLPECLAEAFVAYRATSKGIHPDDLEKFKSGEIDGYTPDGKYVPGPNARSENHSGVLIVDE
ncbi:MAG: hypothetical protein AAFZ07_20210 [Actinomycetota bacterium]